VPVAVTLNVGALPVRTVASVGCTLIVGAVGVGAGAGDELPPHPANKACTTVHAAAFWPKVIFINCSLELDRDRSRRLWIGHGVRTDRARLWWRL
jgi:hypothetical protein